MFRPASPTGQVLAVEQALDPGSIPAAIRVEVKLAMRALTESAAQIFAKDFIIRLE